MPCHHGAVHGRAMIERALQRLADEGWEGLHLDTIRIDTSGVMAVEFGGYSLSVRRGNEPQTSDRGKYIAAWRRFGGWRILGTCWTTEV
jgi:ketosteroid isomerase-like protein